MEHKISATTRAAIVLLAGFALFATACGGSTAADVSDAVSDTLEDSAAQTEPAENNNSADPGAPEEIDRLQALIDRSDASAEVVLASGGRLVLGVSCLDGYESPTAILEAQGIDMPVGQHEPEVEPATGRPGFIVIDTDQPGLPANGASAARQTGFEAASYTITYSSLGEDAVFVLPGCS